MIVTTADVREWAADNGFEVAERGRLPQDVKAAYKKKFPKREVVPA